MCRNVKKREERYEWQRKANRFDDRQTTQNYYGIAVRSNAGNLANVKKAIPASLFPCTSSKETNLHNHCSEGAESWCHFNKDLANNKRSYKPGPGLPVEIIQEIKLRN